MHTYTRVLTLQRLVKRTKCRSIIRKPNIGTITTTVHIRLFRLIRSVQNR
ncbi:hypothetical protein C4K00_1771 [Pseudomonas synxantha]|nr:hypothetical protein C4K00_1771 [Pseudomonas synxantha]AZE77677.1 hypothetical protein C4J99_1878 [Pseudomonas synxantha]